ncbi:MAG: hydantoinase B/oxoprolinase family protein [Gammaproteobacteria bacterium]|nr:hydantoinase B/oxoprolinase family protein [Gammaproteobacteria bacterium]
MSRNTETESDSSIDPVTLEVLRGRFDAVADEMEHTLLKASFSSIVSEAQDATAAVFDARGRTVAQACAIPIHLGALSELGLRFFQKYPPGVAKKGDLYLVNDPYAGGTHLPDFGLASPVFVGDQLVGYVATMTHHQDIGGAAPGSASTDVYDHHSEGIRIPLVRLATAGEIDTDMIDLLTANSRSPDNMRGDLFAQVAGCRTGERRMAAVFEDMGHDVVTRGIDALLDYGERLTRLAIEQIPDGEYEFSDWLDNEGLAEDSDPVEIRVKLTVSGSDVTFDFTGTAPQVRAAINNVPSSSVSCVYYAIRAMTGDAAPNNGGCFRPISIILPPGTLVNPTYPAPVNARGIGISRMIDAVMGVMSKAIPNRFNAAGCGHANIFLAGGAYADGKRFTGALGGPLRSGMGARPTKDGIDVADHELSNVYHVPIEVTEKEFPVRYRRLQLWADSGGPGRCRGGLGFSAEVEWLSGKAVLSVRGERHKFQPWGVQGGQGAPVCRTQIVDPDGSVHKVPAKIVQPIHEGQTLQYWSTGGGGYGRPTERNPERVLDDVLDGRVSVEAAEQVYGVVITDGKLDAAATREKRREAA